MPQSFIEKLDGKPVEPEKHDTIPAGNILGARRYYRTQMWLSCSHWGYIPCSLSEDPMLRNAYINWKDYF